MNQSDPLFLFPDMLHIDTEGALLRYLKQSQLYAVHGPVPPHLETVVEDVLEQGSLTICRGIPPPSGTPSLTITPVYRSQPQGPMVVPTGRIFVRFLPDTPMEKNRKMLGVLGYVIEQIPPYAPCTAWIQSATGDIATSLRNIDQLRVLPGIVHAEPQLLRQRIHRTLAL